MTPNLMSEIDALSREHVIEAAGFVATSLGVTSSTSQDVAALLADWRDHPYKHLEQAEELARLVLSVGATDPELQPVVADALEGAGRKQVVFAGAEIVALAALALGALQVCLSRGKTFEEIAETNEVGPDGRKRTTTTRTTKWGISSSLGSLLKGVSELGAK
jgi:hypothetical protein